jgi:glycosyltransferase involved in cell wall biosynthesis
MRVLWFTNIPLQPVTRKLGFPDIVRGGWMDSLMSALQNYPNLKLGVVSASEFDYDFFEESGTKFYNIQCPSEHGKLITIYRRWVSTIDVPNGLSKCVDVVENFKPDLIHVHGSERFYGAIADKTSIPTVISIQGILTVYEEFYFGRLSFKDKLRDILSLNFLRGIDSFHQYRFMKKSAIRERQILKSCKYFLGRTEFDKNFISLIHPDCVYHHCDEVLRPPFYSGEWTPEPSWDKFIIYCTSSGNAPYKGLDCLLSACHILKINGLTNIQLRVAGGIQNSSLWHIIRNKVDALDLSENLVWLGECSAEKIVSELSHANVFVLPSYIENSPNTLAEAMLVGTPCIASYVGGVPSMVTHGKDGLLFPSGDFYSLAGEIAKIIRDPSLAKSLSENAKITAHKRHDPQRIAATMMNIYSEIIDNSNYGR